MPDYNFQNISPYEFEVLSRDVLQKKFNITLESFTSGRDDGIDLRYANGDNKVIVQCKRYETYHSLFSNLKKEVDKVNGLLPKRYILTTSVGLTPGQKDNILNLFKPHIQQSSDIIGRNDLNNLLNLYPEIEKKHFKLWLSSVNIIETILKSRIYNLAAFEKESILETIKIYVDNKSFNQAVEIIKRNNFVIISGIPGIGKTTLARMLTYHYLAHGYEEFIYISESINDGYEMFHSNKKQIFFFDDFLGSNFLENKLSQNEDSRLIHFIEKIKKSENKILILTTREYILAQAREKYEKIDQSFINTEKCIIDLKSYSKLAKAQILYNHLVFSDLPKEYVNNIIQKQRYMEILMHPNYNPRIIKSITTKEVWQKIKPINYLQKVVEYLDYPENIWKHAFTNQITELSRNILICMMTYGNAIELTRLQEIVNKFYEYNFNIYRSIPSTFEFHKSIKEIEGTFIIIQKDRKNNNVVTFENPSVLDFLLNHIRDSYDLIKNLISSAVYLNQLLAVFTIDRNKNYKQWQTRKIYIGDNNLILFLNKIINDFDNLIITKPIQPYSIDTTYPYYKEEIDEVKIISLIENLPVNQNKQLIELVGKIYNERLKDDIIHNFNNHIKIIKTLKNRGIVDEIETINSLENQLVSISDVEAFAALKEIFPDSFNKFLLDNKELYGRFKEIINDQIRESSDNSIGDLLDYIYTIEKGFNYDFTEETKIITTKLEELENNSSDDYIEHEHERDYENQIIQDNKSIINMFSGLREL